MFDLPRSMIAIQRRGLITGDYQRAFRRMLECDYTRPVCKYADEDYSIDLDCIPLLALSKHIHKEIMTVVHQIKEYQARTETRHIHQGTKGSMGYKVRDVLQSVGFTIPCGVLSSIGIQAKYVLRKVAYKRLVFMHFKSSFAHDRLLHFKGYASWLFPEVLDGIDDDPYAQHPHAQSEGDVEISKAMRVFHSRIFVSEMLCEYGYLFDTN